MTSEQAIAVLRALVIYEDGRQVESDRLVRDPATELVVLAVDPRSVRVKEAEWGDSQDLQLGDWVLAIGRSSSQAGTVSAGIVSSRAASSQDDVLKTDAVVGASGSGGPLVNLEGRIVGINLARLDPRGWPDGFGQAIPAERARRCVSDLAEFGQVRRGYLGLMVASAGGLALDVQGQAPGLVITGLTMGSPAADAGLRVGRSDRPAGRAANQEPGRLLEDDRRGPGGPGISAHDRSSRQAAGRQGGNQARDRKGQPCPPDRSVAWVQE